MENELKNLSLKSLVEIKDLSKDTHLETTIKIRAFVDNVRGLGKTVFFILRDRLNTVQCVLFISSNATEEEKEEFKKIKKTPAESFVEIVGKVKTVSSPVEKCTVKNLEIEIAAIKILGAVLEKLPFNPKDALKKEDESRAKIGYNIRLDNRFLDFRIPSTYCIAKIVDSVYFAFRSFLRKNDFLEIKSTKIIQSGSEGGANLFSMNYFNKTAYLAQSPQLYKQMAIIGGFKRVYEIGHVYRAEVSNINRYLSEFTGLDLEMEMPDDYIAFLHFLHSLFVDIFEYLKNNCSNELEIIREYSYFDDLQYKTTPYIISHSEAIDLLREKGINIGYEEDFNREQEKILGGIVKEKEGVDIFIVKDYPKDVRAFYTYVCKETGKTRSYDFIMRGEEILSGAQREHDYNELKKAIIAKGIDVNSLNSYLEPFKFGAPPHIGCGIGLERFMKSYFGFDDIRYFSLFPRDPSRLNP